MVPAPGEATVAGASGHVLRRRFAALIRLAPPARWSPSGDMEPSNLWGLSPADAPELNPLFLFAGTGLHVVYKTFEGDANRWFLEVC